MTSYIIPTDPIDLLRDRVLFMVGAGRSGTTILGKLIGSMRPTFYLYEPTLLRFWIYPHTTCSEQGQAAMRSILFEDYILPLVQGRSVNENPRDDSYVGNYAMSLDLEQRREQLRRRQDAIKYIQEHRPIFVIKDPELMVVADELKRVFPGCRFIHIIRNGLDVVASCMKRGWYTDKFMAEQMPFWCKRVKGVNVPWYLGVNDSWDFPDYDPPTRAAMVWRVLVEKETGIGLPIRYGGLIDVGQIDEISLALAERYYLQETTLTDKHIDSICNFTPTLYDYQATLDQIQQPERYNFMGLMGKLGYGI